MVKCTFSSSHLEIGEKNTNMHGSWSILLAIASLTVLIFSNIRRVKLIWEYKTPQPEVHRLMPNTYRNIQMAWICNLYAIAIILESTSLSEYLIDYGSTIVPGKEKNMS